MVIRILETAGKIILAVILVTLWVAPHPVALIRRVIVRVRRFFRGATATIRQISATIPSALTERRMMVSPSVLCTSCSRGAVYFASGMVKTGQGACEITS